MRLPLLALRPARQPALDRVRPRRERQGRHARRFRHDATRPAQAARNDVLRHGVRHAVALTRRNSRPGSAPRSSTASAACCATPAGGHRPLHPGAAEQLEALHRERARHLSREPAAPVLRHLPHHPPESRRRRDGERNRRAPCLGHARAAAGRGQQLPGTALGQGSFRLADPVLLGMHDEFHDDIQLQILSILPGFVLQQMHNALAVRQIVPRGVERPISTGPISASSTTRRNCAAPAEAGQPGRAGRLRLDGGRRGRRLRAARHRRRRRRRQSVVEMGGAGAETQETRATEASVRGFWKA